MTVTLGELAVRFGCELRGDPSLTVDSVAALSQAGPRAVTFLANPKYVTQLAGTRAGAVILDARSAASAPVPVLVVDNPHATYARVATFLHPDPPLQPGRHPSAVVDSGAIVDPSAQVCAQAFVGEGARIGARCFIGPGAIVERGAILGDDSRCLARAFIAHHVVIGRRCIVHPGAVIGSDGFGYAPEKGAWIKVPQIGGVNIGDDVEIGANTTIDRGALGDTVIEDGVKLDNLIMIAHNVRIGAHSALAACVAIAGSSVLGKRCILGGKAGLNGHITLCDDVVVLGTSFISHSISKPGVYSSALPSEEASAWRRIVGRIKRLDPMAKRLRAVEKHLGLGAAHKDSSED
ncbi:MAG TPA: UDP-3-O-(3-hydroxymyristoyl)glucosamine N-acyltransferase [Steroidobacteraceae bacterium]|jgi:UDP-3-O-[3-hydroxymyristoyl] glucosamine N-acyltransferase|nr:UDP-3-O-(3-hydroxymyristoyl)glucosamine N-acyltransferase [Steroidobacteraceae bacterium]